jgi:hypothetical protein
VTTTSLSSSVVSVSLLIVGLSLPGFHGGQNIVQPVVVLGQGVPQHAQLLIDLGYGGGRQAAWPPGALNAA